MRSPWVFGATLVAVATARAGAADADVWSRVPPLPTGCYRSDGYDAKLQAARATVDEDIKRQKAINQQLQDQVKNADPMELASRQQQWMMDHPEQAMALMQRNAALGTQEASDDRLQDLATEQQFQKDLDAVDATYRAALDAAFAPTDAKFQALHARAQKDLERTEAGDFYKPWAVKEWNAIQAERSAAYEKACATWWSASGPYRGWLKRYQDFKVGLIPKREEADAVGAGFMVIMVGTPKASFKSTAALDAVNGYMEEVGKVYAKRWQEPAPESKGIDSGQHAFR